MTSLGPGGTPSGRVGSPSLRARIRGEIVNKYIQLDRREVTVMFTEAHPFFYKGKAVKEEVDGDVGS